MLRMMLDIEKQLLIAKETVQERKEQREAYLSAKEEAWHKGLSEKLPVTTKIEGTFTPEK